MPEPTDVLREHSYDGIQEYDNPLPGWWNWLFAVTVVFSVFYLIYYHGGMPDRGIHTNYQQAVADNLRLQFAELGELEPTRENILQYMNEPEWLLVGQIVYKANCISCHGAEGEGKIGPNLTDEYYKNVRVVEEIAQVIANGAAGGAMPAWKNRLHRNEVVLTASYIATMRGKDLSGRAPEGRIIPPWDVDPAEGDSTPAEEAESAPKSEASGEGETPGDSSASSDEAGAESEPGDSDAPAEPPGNEDAPSSS